jgi:23S rRNA pseudouridine2605 synthase
MAKDRLQKIIAQSGVCSRRQAEQLILEGKVKVNGIVMNTLGAKADIYEDKIDVNGKRIAKPDNWTYVMLNKPPKYITSRKDDLDRPTVFELLKGLDVRLFSVGRLDGDTEGLLLLTNDGQLSNVLTHPAGEIPKTYQVKVSGKPSLMDLEKLQQGVLLEDGMAKVDNLFYIQPGRQVSENNTWLEITISEGRNRLIRRMMEKIGHNVIRLRRVKFASLELDYKLKQGEWRHLKADEVRKLKNMADQASQKKESQDTQLPSKKSWSGDF